MDRPRQASKILITGCAGFIGSHLAAELLKKNQVLGIDNMESFLYDSDAKHRKVRRLIQNKNFEFREFDIRNLSDLDAAFAEFRPDVVVHLAARAAVRPSLENPYGYESVNIVGTLNVLECAKKYLPKKMIFASSSSVYGLNKVPFSEDDIISTPISPYAATKVAGEVLCHAYSHLYKIPIVVLRFFTVYGDPSMRTDMAVHKFFHLMRKKEPITMFGQGQERDFVHVNDVVRAVIAAAERNLPRNFEVINVGGGMSVPVRHVVRLLEAALNTAADIRTSPPIEGDVKSTWADVSKAKRLLGWAPTIPIEEGIKMAAKEYHSYEKRKRKYAPTRPDELARKFL